MIKNKDIPGKPGIYLFKKSNKILYIGKAKNLKNRVASYFRGKDHLVIDNLLNQADDIEFIVTENEKDALLLEYNLVHTYRPPFNVKLKDDKSFPFIEITQKDEFPGAFFSRKTMPGHFYAGPITNSQKARTLLDTITRIFKLRTCTLNTFKRGVACLYYHIDRCSAPCIGEISREYYLRDVNNAVLLLKGKGKTIIEGLKKKMLLAAENLEFEEAQKIKEELELLNSFVLESYISTVKKTDCDVIALHLDRGNCFIILFSVIEGRIKGKEFFNFDTLSSDREEVLKDFLITYYQGRFIPREIIVRFYPTDREAIEELLSQLSGRNTRIRIPLKGDKKKMSDLAVNNLGLYVNKTDYSVISERLREALHLTRSPGTIEGYDISHFSERERVGAVVTFSNGKADRKRYRNYIIKEAQAGDTEALKEVLTRRFRKAESFPDLLLIDGGKGQLSAVLQIKSELNITSDVVSIAKREERLFLEDGGSVVLPDDSPESLLLRSIRDEVHRRAITHHRKRREKLKR
ncbi:MAG: excinuclease ABC subunit UvrC [bacterium]|nr:excinuclease ABC subunit UvrC [bacterium]